MLIAEPVSRSSSLLSHRRSLLWLCTAGFCGSEVMTAIKGCPLMSASRKDRISFHFSAYSLPFGWRTVSFSGECQRFAVACQPSEDEQSGSETTSEKEYAGIAYDPYGQVAGMQADEQQAGRYECRGAYKYQGRRPEHFEVIDFSHAAKI